MLFGRVSSLGTALPHVLLQIDLRARLEVPTGGTATRVPWTLHVCSFRRDARGMVREERDACLRSQIGRVNLGDPRGGRCRGPGTLTSLFFTAKTLE